MLQEQNQHFQQVDHKLKYHQLNKTAAIEFKDQIHHLILQEPKK